MNQTGAEAAVFQAGKRRSFMNRRTIFIVFAVLIFLVLFGVCLAGRLLSDDRIAADFSQNAL